MLNDRISQSRTLHVAEAVAELNHIVEGQSTIEPRVLKDLEFLESRSLRVQCAHSWKHGCEGVSRLYIEDFGRKAAVNLEICHSFRLASKSFLQIFRETFQNIASLF